MIFRYVVCACTGVPAQASQKVKIPKLKGKLKTKDLQKIKDLNTKSLSAQLPGNGAKI